MIKAIIFDCFGVLATDELLPFLHQHFDKDPARLQKAMDMCRQVDAGSLDYDGYIAAIAAMAGVSERIAHQQIDANAPDVRLFAYIQDVLRPRYRLGLLSNAGRNWLNDIFTSDQLALFDATQLSYEAGVLKPEPRAYTLMAERLRVERHECVLVDDQERYVAGAQAAGMQAILYRQFEPLPRELEVICSGST